MGLISEDTTAHSDAVVEWARLIISPIAGSERLHISMQTKPLNIVKSDLCISYIQNSIVTARKIAGMLSDLFKNWPAGDSCSIDQISVLVIKGQ